MKKFKKVLFCVLALAVTACLAFGIAACGGGGGDNGKSMSGGIPAPEISVSDDGIFWATITGADGYEYRYGAEEWKPAQRPLAFPTSAGSYKLGLRATANGNKGTEASYEFTVKIAAVEAVKSGNAIVFTGDKIMYSVNGGAEGEVNSDKTLDFSAATVGTEYKVTYYAKADYWQAGEKTYYRSSAKQDITLTVTNALATPVLTVKGDGTGIEWSDVDGATGYLVKIDGTEQQTSGREAAFPQTVGDHVITVTALGDASHASSEEAEYGFTVKKLDYPDIVYGDDGKIVWDNSYDGKVMQSTNGGEFSAVDGDVTAEDGLKLKVAARFDEDKRIYWLESAAVSFVEREAPALTFKKEGTFTWGEDDSEGMKNYGVSIAEYGEEDNYVAATSNVSDVSLKDPGKYTIKVKNLSGVEMTADGVVFYIPSEAATADFTVLATPVLTFANGKILWQEQTSASGYQCTKKGGEPEIVYDTNEYTATAGEIAEYTVVALGNDEGSEYSVTSKSSSILFDADLRNYNNGAMDVFELGLFNKAEYADQVLPGYTMPNGTREIITSSTDPDEQAILAGSKDGGVLKVVSSGIKKFPSNPGSYDGMQFNLFTPIDLGLDGTVIFRIYLKSNPERGNKNETCFGFGVQGYDTSINGIKNNEIWRGEKRNDVMVSAAPAEDEWTEVIFHISTYSTLKDLRTVTCNFTSNGLEGDVFYIDEIRFERGFTDKENDDRTAHDVTGKMTEVLKQANSYQVLAQTGDIYIGEGTSTDGDYLMFHSDATLSNTNLFAINYDNVALKTGDIIRIKIKVNWRNSDASETSVNININDDYSNYIGSSTDIKTVDLNVKADTTLTAIKFFAKQINVNGRGRYTIEIFGVDILSGEDVDKNFDASGFKGFTGASEARITNIKVTLPGTMGYTCTVEEDKIHFESEGAIVPKEQIQNSKKAFLTIEFEGLTLQAGQKLKITLNQKPGKSADGTAYTQVAAPQLFVNGQYNNWANAEETMTLTTYDTTTGTINSIAIASNWSATVPALMAFNFDIVSIEVE